MFRNCLIRRLQKVQLPAPRMCWQDWSYRVLGLLLVGALALTAVLTLDHALAPVAADPPALPMVPTQTPPAPMPPAGTIQRATATTTAAVSPLHLLNQAAQTYQRVQDYTCIMVKQERVQGQLQPENIIEMKFRKQPFSVHMRWLGPRQFQNQEVCYIHGRNNNMMRVKAPGLLKLVGYVSIPPNDPRALEHSRHNITEAGIGNLLARCLNDWNKEQGRNRSQVRVDEYMFNNQPCTRVEATLTQRMQQDYCYRTVLYLDKQTHLPVRVECYDWPQQGGQPGGELLEVYSYVNMRFNVGLTDDDFPQ